MDTISPINQDFSEAQTKEVTKHIGALRAPRRSWQEFILFFFTLNVYACFWTYGRARDLKRMSANEFSPWLWFFAPLTGLPLIIAFSRMFTVLTEQEKQRDIVSWKSAQWLWITLLVVFSTLVGLQEKFGWPIWIFVLSWVVISALFSVLHKRFNVLKLSLEGVNYHGRKSGYYWYEWVALGVASPLVLAILYISIVSPLLVSELEKIENGQIITDGDTGLTYKIHGNGWTKVEVGTFSDGTALAEYDGPLFDDHLLLFDWGDSYSIGQASSERIDRFYSEYSDATCVEQRSLSTDAASVVSTTRCDAKYLGTPVTELSAFVGLDGRTFELYGYLSDEKIPHQRVIENMVQTSKSFSIR